MGKAEKFFPDPGWFSQSPPPLKKSLKNFPNTADKSRSRLFREEREPSAQNRRIPPFPARLGFFGRLNGTKIYKITIAPSTFFMEGYKLFPLDFIHLNMTFFALEMNRNIH